MPWIAWPMAYVSILIDKIFNTQHTTDYCVEGFVKDSNKCRRKRGLMLCQATPGDKSELMAKRRHQAIQAGNKQRVFNQNNCLPYFFSWLTTSFLLHDYRRYYPHMKLLRINLKTSWNSWVLKTRSIMPSTRCPMIQPQSNLKWERVEEQELAWLCTSCLFSAKIHAVPTRRCIAVFQRYGWAKRRITPIVLPSTMASPMIKVLIVFVWLILWEIESLGSKQNEVTLATDGRKLEQRR